MCPIGAKCVAWSNTSTMVLSPGYWRSSTASDKILKCSSDEICLGADGCRDGHEGPFCRL